jgi:hypothetical protein
LVEAYPTLPIRTPASIDRTTGLCMDYLYNGAMTCTFPGGCPPKEGGLGQVEVEVE